MSSPLQVEPDRGWSDSIGFEFADAENGLFGFSQLEIFPARGTACAVAVLFDHEEVVGSVAEAEVPLDVPSDWGDVSVAGVAIRDDSQAARFALDAGPASFDLQFHGAVSADLARGSWAGTVTGAEQHVAAGTITGEVRGNGKTTQVKSLGRAMRTIGSIHWDRIGVVRWLGAAFEDGGLLTAWAARPARAEGHGQEAISAAIVSGEGELTVPRETLLSTQYDEAGRQRHANLEIVAAGPEEESEDDDEDVPVRPLRAAGALICGTSLDLGKRRLDTAFFRWSMEGRPGLGRYDAIWPKK